MRALLVAAALAAAVTPFPAYAGTTGSLTGTVTNVSAGDAPVANATVIVMSLSQREQTVTDTRGHFSFVSLAPGTFKVWTERAGLFAESTFTFAINSDMSVRTSLQMSTSRHDLPVDDDVAPSNLFQPGKGADGYIVSSDSPFYSFDGHDIYALHFIPGLTFGPGPVLSR